MEKITSILLCTVLTLAPLTAGAQSVVQSSLYKSPSIAAAKKPAKKTVKKATKKSATSAKSKAVAAPSASCTIKGNISATKEKIFHVIGCPNYGQTVIDTTKGERMFCLEQEAKDAGWRKALNCP